MKGLFVERMCDAVDVASMDMVSLLIKEMKHNYCLNLKYVSM
jgi:hypothetical protein